MGFLREIGGLLTGRQVKKAINNFTGRTAAKKAQNTADQYAAEAAIQTAKTEAETKKNRIRAQRLQMRALRSRRSASYYQSAPTGSDTIG